MSNDTFRKVFNEYPLLMYVKDPWRFQWRNDGINKALIVGTTFNIDKEHESCVRWAHEMQSKGYIIYILCDTSELTQFFKYKGLRSEFVNENCWHDEKMFSIEDRQIKYDLVYVAASTRYKNIHLLNTACNDKHVAWICGRIEDREIFNEAKKYNNVTVFGNGTCLTRHEVTQIINESKVGLCLSSQEASMRASCEYRLCGLPVVNVKTTGGKYSPSSCGREILLGIKYMITAQNENHIIVKHAVDYAVDVADGLSMTERVEIRSEYLNGRTVHRSRFDEILSWCALKLGLYGNTILLTPREHFCLTWGSIDKYL